MNKNDPNRNFLLNHYRNIVKTDDGYYLQKVYEEDENGIIRQASDSKTNLNKNEFSKNCYRCIHSDNENCLIRTELENCEKGHYIPFHWVGHCDAYSPVYPLNVINSENEMIDFIENAENFFDYPEEYESYFGFKRKWDEEETGEILETTREYYDRGGRFINVPDKYPCVIYFGVVDFDGGRMRNEKLDCIYKGETNV